MFAIVKNDEANNILQFLNSKHDSIKFTMCMAEQSKLQFLDMVIISVQTTITRIYITNNFISLFKQSNVTAPISLKQRMSSATIREFCCKCT